MRGGAEPRGGARPWAGDLRAKSSEPGEVGTARACSLGGGYVGLAGPSDQAAGE